MDGTEVGDSLKFLGWPARWTLGRLGGKMAAEGPSRASEGENELAFGQYYLVLTFLLYNGQKESGTPRGDRKTKASCSKNLKHLYLEVGQTLARQLNVCLQSGSSPRDEDTNTTKENRST